MTKLPVVIQLSRLRAQAKAWYAKPVLIKIKKSWLVAVILFCLGMAVGMQLAQAQTLPKHDIIKPPSLIVKEPTDTATTNVKETKYLFNRGGYSVSSDPFIQALDKKNNDIKIAHQKLVEAHRQAEKQRAAIMAASTRPEVGNAPAINALPQVYHAPVQVATTDCGSNTYMAYIYEHESGCRTNAVGPNGPCGLGQALPCSKMPCSLYDWGCQDIFFKAYAISTYGSFINAYNHWLQFSWW